MSEQSVDVAIIGAGPGGYVAAIRAAQMGARVTIFERDNLGGTCLNHGCIPTKALIRGVEFVDEIKHAHEYGVDAGEPVVDFTRLQSKKDQVVRTLRSGVAGLMKSNGVEVIAATATLEDRNVVVAKTASGEERRRVGRATLIATGTTPWAPPVPGVDGRNVHNSDTILEVTTVPKSMCIIGGGAVGTEFACIFLRLGCQVTIVEMLPRLIPLEDADLSSTLERLLKRQGIEVLTNTRLASVEDADNGQKRVRLVTGEKESVLEVEAVLLGAGRKANLTGVAPEQLGLQLNRGAITANERMETGVPGIYAIGDVVGGYQLAHVASAEGICAVENALGEEKRMSYRAVPRCVYTLPEVAAVGLTEQQAVEAGYDVRMGRFPWTANSRATIMGDRDGFVKVVSEARYGEVLGVHIIGPHATDLIAEWVTAIQMEATAADIFGAIHPHPTLTEAMPEAALDTLGLALHVAARKK